MVASHSMWVGFSLNRQGQMSLQQQVVVSHPVMVQSGISFFSCPTFGDPPNALALSSAAANANRNIAQLLSPRPQSEANPSMPPLADSSTAHGFSLLGATSACSPN